MEWGWIGELAVSLRRWDVLEGVEHRSFIHSFIHSYIHQRNNNTMLQVLRIEQ